MTPSLLAQGTELLIYGMGTVVVFLALLVVAIRAMSYIVQNFFPEPPAPLTSATVPAPVSAEPASAADSVLMAAAVAAVHAHRARSSNNTP